MKFNGICIECNSRIATDLQLMLCSTCKHWLLAEGQDGLVLSYDEEDEDDYY